MNTYLLVLIAELIPVDLCCTMAAKSNNAHVDVLPTAPPPIAHPAALHKPGFSWKTHNSGGHSIIMKFTVAADEYAAIVNCLQLTDAKSAPEMFARLARQHLAAVQNLSRAPTDSSQPVAAAPEAETSAPQPAQPSRGARAPQPSCAAPNARESCTTRSDEGGESGAAPLPKRSRPGAAATAQSPANPPPTTESDLDKANGGAEMELEGAPPPLHAGFVPLLKTFKRCSTIAPSEWP